MSTGAVIVTTTELNRLKFIAKFWWAGWCFAGILSLALLAIISWTYGQRSALNDVAIQADKIKIAQINQAQLVDGLVQAWQHNEILASNLLTWNETLRAKADALHSINPTANR